LRLDIFSGIIFAAPTSAFIAGLLWKKTPPVLAVVSIFAGLIAGFCAWFLIADPDFNWFVGNMLALFLPALFIIIGSFFSKYEYNFAALKTYESSHKVNITEEV
jgi:Na+/proline symporter